MSLQTREGWYLVAVDKMYGIFQRSGYDIPKFRIGCGWPIGNRAKVEGQCFGKDLSKDEAYEIFVSPTISDPVKILVIIVHELCHAIAGIKAKHGKPFIAVMRAVGMEKKWTGGHPGANLREQLERISDDLGPYPHASLMIEKRVPGKKGSRLLLVECSCGLKIRMTRKWMDKIAQNERQLICWLCGGVMK